MPFRYVGCKIRRFRLAVDFVRALKRADLTILFLIQLESMIACERLVELPQSLHLSGIDVLQYYDVNVCSNTRRTMEADFFCFDGSSPA